MHLNNEFFNLIFSEYQTLHPRVTFCKIICEMSKKQIFSMIVFFLSFISYIALILFSKDTSRILLFFVIFLISACILLGIIKENKKKTYSIKKYQKNNIKPLRKILKKYHLYNLPAIDLLIDLCKDKSEEKSVFEKYLKRAEPLLSVSSKFLSIIMVIIILNEMNILTNESIEPTIEWLFSFLINYFIADYQLGLLIGITLFCALLAFSVIRCLLDSIFQEFYTSKQNKIYSLLNDLQFLRMDFLISDSQKNT